MKKIVLKGMLLLGINMTLNAETVNINNAKEWLSLNKKACKQGDAGGCANLGVIYNDKQEYSKAVQYYRKACDGGNASGCFDLGVAYAEGRGVEKDDLKAVKYYHNACDAGDAKACVNLGVRYAQGNNVKLNYEKARTLFTKACNAGISQGCEYYNMVKGL